MSKRKGREQRRYLKRQREQKNKEPIFSKYNLKDIKGKVVDIKYNKKIYTGKITSYRTGIWSPNHRYAAIVVNGNENWTFYLCNDKTYLDYDGMRGRGEWYEGPIGRGPKAKIIRILPKIDEMLFKIEHSL